MTTMTTSSRRGRSTARTASAAPPRHDPVSAGLAAVVSAGLVALIGIALSLIVTLGSWALAPHTAETGPDTAAQVAVGLWLYAHHVPLELGGVSLGLVPLGLLLVPGLLTYAGGRQLARVVRPQTLADATRAVIPYALVYGVLASIAAAAVMSDAVRPAPRTAFLAATVIAALGGGLGMLRASDQLPQAIQAVPLTLRDMAASAVSGVATVVLLSAVLTMLALGIGFPDAAEMYRQLDAGWAGGPVLVLLTIAFVPNLVLWAAAFSIGLGFPLGPDGMVAPQGIDYGALPVFPPLAALPPQGDPGPWAFVTLAVPLLGGYAVAVVLYRRRHQLPVEHLAARAAAAGALAGATLGLLCWLSAGSLGDQALTSVGPVGWQVGLVAALEMGLVASVVAWELHRRAGTTRPRLIDLRERVSLPTALASSLADRARMLLHRR